MDNSIGTIFIVGAILSLVFIAGLLFLIIYGIVKKKRAFWITGTAIVIVCLFLYMFMFCSRYNAAHEMEHEAREHRH